MMKIRRKILKYLFLVLLISVASCSKHKKEEFIDPKTGEKESIQINRFDRELFAVPDKDIETFLQDLYNKYPEMFSSSMENKEYVKMIEKFITDKYLTEAQSIVQQQYPDISFLEKDLTQAFALLQEEHKETTLPKRFFTMIFGPAEFSYMFENRCYTNGDYSVIALDMYSFPLIEKNPYYSQIPQYMRNTLTKEYIVPDFMRMYLKNITYKDTKDMYLDPDCSLLDVILQEGKYSYMVKNILPSYQDYQVLRYTKEQMKWCQDNEKLIWGYIIQNRLLYEKDRSKYLSLIADGPSSRPLADSPSRVANYIGYNIINEFMRRENITFDSLINLTDSQLILQKSAYKPKK